MLPTERAPGRAPKLINLTDPHAVYRRLFIRALSVLDMLEPNEASSEELAWDEFAKQVMEHEPMPDCEAARVLAELPANPNAKFVPGPARKFTNYEMIERLTQVTFMLGRLPRTFQGQWDADTKIVMKTLGFEGPSYVTVRTYIGYLDKVHELIQANIEQNA